MIGLAESASTNSAFDNDMTILLGTVIPELKIYL